jgi:hypothetical protein
MPRGSQKKRPSQAKLEEREIPIGELARLVADDLEYLRARTWTDLTRTDIRITAMMLRKLLHEGLLLAAWQAMGMNGEPQISAVDLDERLGAVERRYVQYAYAGGANLPDIRASDAWICLMVVPAAELAPLDEAARQARALEVGSGLQPQAEPRPFGLSDLVSSPCAVAGEAAVSRIDVVKYVANKLGSVHLDGRRAAWTNPLGASQRFLDEEHIRVGPWPASHVEIIAIAQGLAVSEDTEHLVATVRERLPDPPSNPDAISFREGRTGKWTEMKLSAAPDALGLGPAGRAND